MDAAHAIDKSKQIQNRSFRFFGVAAAVVGLLGFIPSYSKAAIHGVLWSVSHDSPHTENNFLIPHFIFMIAWLLGAFVQLATGGTSYKKVHRASGYIALLGLFVGMIGAAANVIEYDFASQDLLAGLGAGLYTIVLIIGASVNGAVGLTRAIQKRTKEHKDHMLMAIMWSLDPAVHRFSMWLIRWCSHGNIDPDLLLTFGKLPANFFLVTVFGTMLVLGHRVTFINMTNVSLQFALYIYGCVGGLASDGVSDLVRGFAIGGLCALSLVVITLSLLWRYKYRPQASLAEHDACRNLTHS